MSHPVVQRKITSKWFFNSCIFSLFKCRGCNFCLRGSLSQNSENKRRHGAQRDRGSCLVKPPQLCWWILTWNPDRNVHEQADVCVTFNPWLSDVSSYVCHCKCSVSSGGMQQLAGWAPAGEWNRLKLTSSTCDLVVSCKFKNKWNSSSSETLE